MALVTQTMTPKGFLQDGDHREAVSELGKHYYTQAFVHLVFRSWAPPGTKASEDSHL